MGRMWGFINLSLLALKNNLIVFSTNRKIREFRANSDEFILPKTLSFGEFLQKVIIVENLSKCDEISKIFFMHQACENVKAMSEKLGFANEFFEFMKNSEYLFKFFKELKSAKKSVKELVLADTYDSYSEHLQILDELLKCYLEILEQNGVYDDISVCDLYKINENFVKEFENIEIYIDGFLNKFELEIIAKCANLTNLNLIFKSTKLNKKLVENIANLSEIPLENFEFGKEYILNLSQKTITKSEILPKCTQIAVKDFSLRSLQAAYVFEKISAFVQKGIRPENIAVILPDEEFGEILRLHDRCNMLNFAMGKKLSKTIFYRLLSKVCESINGGEIVKFGALENEISNEYSLFFAQCELDENLYNKIKENFDKNCEFSEFENFINQILDLSAEKLQPFIAKPLFMVEKFLQKKPLNLRECVQIFLTLLSEAKLPHVGGGAVSVLGALESRGMKFDGVIIVDFNDDLVPNRSSGEMFLSSAVRESAGLISHADRENLQRFYYDSLINSAKCVAISYFSSEEKLSSRFLKNFATKKDDEFSQNDYLQSFGAGEISVPSLAQIPAQKHDFFGEALSFSRLNTFLECRRKYYYKYIAKIKENIVFNESDKAGAGNILHDSLREFYEKNAKFDFEKFSQIYKKRATDKGLNKFDIELNLINVKKIEEGFLGAHEQNFSCKACELDIDEREFDGIKIKGKIDRIDESESGQKFVIDYKSGAKGQDKHKSFQLAFYKLLLGDEDCESRFVFFGNAEIIDAHRDYGASELTALISQLKDLFENEVSFDPLKYDKDGEDKKPNCTYCPYKIICKGKINVATR
ncbi:MULTISPECIES: PD-(D/E)XK nuclease family protein [unclassified Campylobacter]|uniref:PD-(D/E)XK nuclease family protein n=1 Tax=unclassified Campylobacter TaxID=2593542 RepID=UPI0022E9CD7D|nr:MULTISPECIES: PD-(D/E)XK nuclease family protein [unclassified Campylobacter]MDA3062160.1 PD-(D/E)XK nuclease family protein [Campylobacter sp. JMF_14 EL1]MDA3072736.1 PD-(D/E)XK nuclease family protein [Campylobacter sp. JMF_10 EL2]